MATREFQIWEMKHRYSHTSSSSPIPRDNIVFYFFLFIIFYIMDICECLYELPSSLPADFLLRADLI